MDEHIKDQDTMPELAALQECQQEVVIWKERYTHLAADFENFKKRQEKDRIQWQFMSKGKIFSEILPVFDNLERALQSVQDNKELMQGIQLIVQDAQALLQRNGIQEISGQGECNPLFHESLVQVPNTDLPSGHIVAVLEKGFLLDGKVLRTAKVSVAA